MIVHPVHSSSPSRHGFTLILRDMKKCMYSLRFPLFALILLTVMSGCVSKKKYSEMESLKNKVQDMLERKRGELKEANDRNTELSAKLDECDRAREEAQQRSYDLAADKARLEKEVSEMRSSCTQLQQNYDKLKSNSTKKMQELVASLEQLQEDLRQREMRLAEVERMLHERDSIVTAIRNRIADALLGFKDKGLTIDMRDGKVYVSLSNKLLFASGSTKIDASGKQALADLAGVLKEQEDITIMVEGHTDNVPIANLGDIKDNWDLSVMRSTEVVRLLVSNGVEPTRIIPSGRGEFIPKVANDGPENKATNRRTEIIISPKLDELYSLINAK